MEVPTLMYGSETWIITKRSLQLVESAETRFLRSVKECSRLDKISTHGIWSELGVYKLTERIQINKINSLQHVEGKEDFRFPEYVLDYKPIGR
jgi:hypothetical protein